MTGECFVYYRFSIVNSCVTVLLLTGFLATILMRVLKNDFLKYTRDDDAAEEAEETGWKYIHGDVFRFPRHGESISFMMLCAIRLSPCVLFSVSLFCACIGTGTQLFAMVLFVFVLALVGVFYPYNRGALLTACIVLYALTAGIAGYVAANNYRQMGGENWYVSLYFRITFVSVYAIRLTGSFLCIRRVRNVLLTGFLFCGPMFIVFSFLNTVAIAYRSTAALPFGTICVIIIIWALVTFPLTVRLF